MTDYIYKAVDGEGETIQGVMTASSEQELDTNLQSQGYWLIEASVQNSKKDAELGPLKDRKVPRKELIDFFNGLNAMLEAGIPISNSIAAIAEETADPHLSQVLMDLKINIEAGNTLDQAMSKHPKAFPNQIVQLIKAGEYSGNLAASCEDISEHLEWLDGIIADVKQASIYPTIILCAVLGLVFLMFAVVVPKFKVVFDGLKLELPMLTQAVVSIGEFTTQYWWAILMVPVIVFITVSQGPRFFPILGYYLDMFKLKVPVFGNLNSMIVQSRFCHNLGLLLKSGVPILEALKLCKGLVDNQLMAIAIASAESAVNEGKKVTDALKPHQLFSPIVLRMMVVGEETGRLDSALSFASKRFDKEVPRQIKKVFGILEPAIMITLICIVGLIGGAVFLPMFSLMSGFGGN